MVRLARFVLRHRLMVALFWLVAFVAGGATAGTTTERLTVDFSLPGQQGYETEQQILALYGTGPDEGTSIVVVTAPQGKTVAGEKAAVDGVFRALQAEYPEYRVSWQGNTGDDRFVTEDGRSTYGLVVDKRFDGFDFKPAYKVAADFLQEQARSTGLTIGTTGYFQLSEGNAAEGDNEPPSLLGETLLGAAGALVVLVFVFASFLALVPLLVAAVSIMSTFLAVLAVSYVTDVSFVVQFLVALVGLGLAIDYSLLLVNRWREEREHGRDNAEAVVEAMRTAGHAVAASAGTVAISLIALIVVPVPFLRSMGFGGMLIPLISMAVVLTLLPVMLSKIGPRVDWPRIRHENAASRAWTAWARLVYKRKWVAFGAGLVLLALLVVPVFDIKIGQARTESLATQGPAVTNLATLRDGGVPAGVVTPLEVLVGGSDPVGSAQEVVTRLEQVDGVASAVAPDDPTWRKGGTAVVQVLPTLETVDTGRAKVVERMLDAIEDVPGVQGVAGPGATVLDYSNAVFKRFPLVMGLIALVTFLLLVRAFRSLLLPLKAVLLNVVSVAATFGFVVLFWQRGNGSGADLRHRADRRGHVLAAGDDLRVPLRPVDGLRGLHPEPDAGGVRQDRLHPAGRRRGPRPHRPAGDLRRADPVHGVHRAGVLARHRHQGARDGARRRHPHRRDHRAGPHGARAGLPARPLELVAAELAGASAADRAVGRRRRAGLRPRPARRGPAGVPHPVAHAQRPGPYVGRGAVARPGPHSGPGRAGR